MSRHNYRDKLGRFAQRPQSTRERLTGWIMRLTRGYRIERRLARLYAPGIYRQLKRGQQWKSSCAGM